MLTIHKETSAKDRLTHAAWQNQLKRLAQSMKPVHVKRIVVGLDFSAAAMDALDHAIDRAQSLGCGIVIVHVLEPIYAEPFIGMPLREQVRTQVYHRAYKKLATISGSKKEKNVPISFDVRFGSPAYEILKIAEVTKPEMIVVGRSQRNVLSRWVFGSVSKTMLEVSPFPVLVVPGLERN